MLMSAEPFLTMWTEQQAGNMIPAQLTHYIQRYGIHVFYFCMYPVVISIEILSEACGFQQENLWHKKLISFIFILQVAKLKFRSWDKHCLIGSWRCALCWRPSCQNQYSAWKHYSYMKSNFVALQKMCQMTRSWNLVTIGSRDGWQCSTSPCVVLTRASFCPWMWENRGW